MTGDAETLCGILGDPPGFDGCFVRGMKMKHQVQLGTESGIVSNEAVKHLRMPITDLANP